MNKKKEISLVIGCIFKELNLLISLLNNLDKNIEFINEVICVISGVNSLNKIEVSNTLKRVINIKSKIIILESVVMPGEARNIGIINSECDNLCFLDSHTIPSENWLQNSISIIKKKGIRGVLGRTQYIALNEFENCFISATYGYNPLFTIQGTLIQKSLLNEIGFFIPNTRSGEDSEWINRSISFEKDIKQRDVLPLSYKGLKGMSFWQLCKKWYIYYKSTTLIIIQKYIYITIGVGFSVLVALSWNDRVASWDQNSLLYIPHVSKIIVFIIILFYLLYRLLILPSRKNVNFSNFTLMYFLKFSFISIVLDLVKLIAFINNKKSNN